MNCNLFLKPLIYQTVLFGSLLLAVILISRKIRMEHYVICKTSFPSWIEVDDDDDDVDVVDSNDDNDDDDDDGNVDDDDDDDDVWFVAGIQRQQRRRKIYPVLSCGILSIFGYT